MTSDDDPFGRSDRTIIRPNPGGRRATQPPAPDAKPRGGAPPAAAPRAPVSYPPPQAPPPRAPVSYPPPQAPPAAAYPARPFEPSPPPAASGDWDEWMNPRAPRDPYGSPGAPTPMTPAPVSPHIPVEVVTGAASPLMRAAASLLLLLGRLRASLARGTASELMDQVAQAIQAFEADARAGAVPADQVRAAKYALAACADDIVQHLPNEDCSVYLRYSMLVRFFDERMGGVRFFDELDRAKQSPSVNLGLLQIMHACLSLGFEGRYRASGGPGALQGIRRDLYETIRRAQPKAIEDLSPHWRGQAIPLAGSRFEVPVWAVAALAAAVLLGSYLYLRSALTGETEALAARMAAIHPATALTIGAGLPVRPPKDPAPKISTQLQRIRAALANEIMANKVAADQTDTSIFIRIGSVVLFPSGGATVKDSFAPIGAKIAAALDKEPGAIHIDGYTDADPVKTLTFPSNVALSEARAKSVAAMLKPHLADPTRLTIAAKGAANPIADNDIEEHKSRNRRVEVWIPRAD